MRPSERSVQFFDKIGSKSKMRFINVAGLPPELGKDRPLCSKPWLRREKRIEPLLVDTGQHYDQKLSEIFFQKI